MILASLDFDTVKYHHTNKVPIPSFSKLKKTHISSRLSWPKDQTHKKKLKRKAQIPHAQSAYYHQRRSKPTT
jgi:hypothetical protein